MDRSLWWACTTATTVGYGDISPVTPIGRITAVVLMHVGPLFVIPMIVAQILSRTIKNMHEFTHEEQEEIKSLLRSISKRLDDKD